MQELARLLEALLEDVFASLPSVPSPYRDLFAFLQTEAVKRFPGMKDKVVGGFFFLRFICPALVSPEQWGLVSGMETRHQHLRFALSSHRSSSLFLWHAGAINPRIRRTLILVSKVVQNLANELEFGDKEAYMMPLNACIQANVTRMKSFLSSVASPVCAPSLAWTTRTGFDGSLATCAGLRSRICQGSRRLDVGDHH